MSSSHISCCGLRHLLTSFIHFTFMAVPPAPHPGPTGLTMCRDCNIIGTQSAQPPALCIAAGNADQLGLPDATMRELQAEAAVMIRMR